MCSTIVSLFSTLSSGFHRPRLRGAVAWSQCPAQLGAGGAKLLVERRKSIVRPLLDAQRSVIAADMAALDSRTQLALDAVQLFKALGGGWQVGAGADVLPPATPAPQPAAALSPLSQAHLESHAP